MTYEAFLTAFRGAGATLQNANDAARMMDLKRHRNWTQATWISKVAEEAMKRETADRQRAEREAAETARKAKLAAEADRRGTLESFVERAKDMAEADREMSWALRRFLGDLEAWPHKLAEFKKNLDKHPTYALSWSGDVFQAAATYEVAVEVKNYFEAGVEWADLVDKALKEALRGARNLGNSRSTSNCSNLVDDAKTKAWADAYERLSGKSAW